MNMTRWVSLLLFGLCAGGLSAQTTFTVTTLADSGTGSLREAITMANSTSGTDSIQFGVNGTISLDTALPVITEAVTIDGPGRTSLVIERSSGAATDFRILETSVIGIVLNINELTIQGGRASQGAGIFSRGPTGILDVLIQDCIADGAAGGGNGQGGGIYHSPAIAGLTITNSLIQNCQAVGGDNVAGNGGAASGGAIYVNAGSLGTLSTTIDNCDALGGNSTGGNGNGGIAQGGGIFSVFAVTLTDSVVSNCTAVGGSGNGTGVGAQANGGGIVGTGAITSIDTTWQANSVTSERTATGGAISFSPSSTQQLTVTRSVLNANSANSTVAATGASAFGAAIISTGVVEIRESTIAASVANAPVTYPADVINHSGGSTFLMERTTYSGNTGGILIATSATIINSTLSGNTSTATPGILNVQGGSVNVTFCTVTSNNGQSTGGVFLASGVVTMIGTILAENTGSLASTSDYAISTGTLADGGGNVVGIDDSSNFTNGGTQAGTSGTPLDPMLGPLMDNGGLTFTHALLSGSPAIDNGGATAVPTTDQRNATRDSSADAGAFEFGVTVPGGQGQAGGEGDERCSTSEAQGINWLILLGLIAIAGLGIRRRTA